MKPSAVYRFVWTLIGTVAITQTAAAVTVPFTEDFVSSSSNWTNRANTAVLSFVPTGGPDGGSYASSTLSLQGTIADSTTVLLRGHTDTWNASGGALAGDWVDDGVRKVSAFVRHNTPDPLDYFVRVSQTPFPGAIYGYTTVQPNTWTEIIFNVGPGSDQIQSDEGSAWVDTFANIARVQFGVVIPSALTTDPTQYTFNLDKVTLNTPEPTSLILLAGAGIMLLGRLRRRAA